MQQAVLVAVGLVLIAVGWALFFDYRGIVTWYQADVERWWQAGPLRRKFGYQPISMRPIAVITAALGVIILIAAFQH